MPVLRRSCAEAGQYAQLNNPLPRQAIDHPALTGGCISRLRALPPQLPPLHAPPLFAPQGNKLLWDYDESRDPELQEVFNLVTAAGINLFDTADSYGGLTAFLWCLSRAFLPAGHLRSWHQSVHSTASDHTKRSAVRCLPAGTGKLNGRSEQLLGRFIDEYPGSDAVRDNVRIATKLAAYPWRLTPQQAGRLGGGRGAQQGCLAASEHWWHQRAVPRRGCSP